MSAQEKPKLLDGCCGAGGAARGYADLFDVVGIDAKPQPRFPYGFVLGDIRDAMPRLLSTGEFCAIHVSPPCQAHSDLQKQSKRSYVDLIPEVRAICVESGLPYVIENVEGAPLREPVVLCGSMFPELRVYRHRLFESNVVIPQPVHPRHERLTFTYDSRKAHCGVPLDLDRMCVQVTGGGNAPVWAKRRAMGIDWMIGRELNEAIPPAYTAYIAPFLVGAA